MSTITIDNSKSRIIAVLDANFDPPIDLRDGYYEICLDTLFANFNMWNVAPELDNNTFTYIKNGQALTSKISPGISGVNRIIFILEDV